MAAHGGKINLLPQSEFATSGWGKLLTWAVSWGRYILILVELVVITAFLSRFKLDREVADLKESITSRAAIVEAASASESRFRDAQARLAAAAAIIKSQADLGSITERVAARVPAGVGLTQLTVAENEAGLQATAVSAAALGQFLSQLSADQKWQGVELVEVNSQGGTGIKFTLKISW